MGHWLGRRRRESGRTASPRDTVQGSLLALHASLVDALHRHLPSAVVVLLLMTAAVAVGSVGFGTGVSGGGRLVGNFIFVLVTA